MSEEFIVGLIFMCVTVYSFFDYEDEKANE